MTTKNKSAELIRVAVQKYFLPLLLGAVVMNIIFKTYMPSGSGGVTAVYAVYQAALFFLFEKLKPRKVFRGIAYLFMLICVLFLGMRLIRMGNLDSGKSFLDWFYLNSQDVGEVDLYLYFIFISLGFFITSILYYFTVYRYRTFGVMLIILFPFIIYGKRDDRISEFSITLMLTIFLALMVHERLVSDDYEDKTTFDLSYLIAVALFVTFTGAVTMFLPKPSVKSSLENNNGNFELDFDTEGSKYEDISEESSPRYGGEPTGEILFNMTTTEDEDVVYLRRQSFDVFKGDNWVNGGEFHYYFEDEEEALADNEINSPEYVYSLMKKLAQTGRYEKYGLKEELFDEIQYAKESWINEYSSTFRPYYIPAPLMASTELSDYAVRDIFGDVYFANGEKNKLGVSFPYTVEGEAEYAYAKELGLNQTDFLELIREAYINGDVTKNQYKNFLSVNIKYSNITYSNDDMLQLAEDITSGLTSDFDKAQAIVDYFENNGYSYDMYYDPDDDSIEYFLFESKLGNCTCYATSMTLLARYAGLPARYVEGFAAYEKNDNGEFVIRDSHAHAFVEVYISGVGWMTFDPTVSGYMTDYSDVGTGEFLSKFMEYFSRIILFLGVIFVLVFIIFIDRITETFFRISLKFKSPEIKAVTLYTHILKLLEISSRSRLKGCTPQELSDFAAERRNADISYAAELFEKTCFGGYIPTAEEFGEVYTKYKLNWKAILGKTKEGKKRKANA